MAYGLKYMWASKSGDSFGSEYTAIFADEDQARTWCDAMTGPMQERLVIIGEGEISSDLADTLDFISEQIPYDGGIEQEEYVEGDEEEE